MSNLMEVAEPLARKLEYLDEKISRLNHEIDELKSEREKINQEVVAIMQEQGIQTTLGLRGGGTLKLYTDVYPSVKDMPGLEHWAHDNGVQLPGYTFNPKTLQAWFREQIENDKPIPPDTIMSSFTKTKAKVLKK